MPNHTGPAVMTRRAASGPTTRRDAGAVRERAVEVPTTLPAPDWYPDPISAEHHRWWSGVAWTGYTQRVIPAPPRAPRHSSSSPASDGEPPTQSATEPEPATRSATVPAPEPASVPVLEPVALATVTPAPAPEPVLVAAPRASRPVASLPPSPVEMAVRTAAAASIPVQRYVPPPPEVNIPGRVALGAAIAGILTGAAVAFWPILLPVSLLLLVVAAIIAVAALPKWGRRRGVAVLALVLAILGLAIGPLILGQDGREQLIAGDLSPIGIDVSLSGERTAALGELVVLGDGIAVTVQAVDCEGERCTVTATIANGTEMPIMLRAADVAVLIAGTQYRASAALSDLGGASSPTAIDPATGIEASFVMEVPAGAAADAAEIHAEWAGGQTLRVAAAG